MDIYLVGGAVRDALLARDTGKTAQVVRELDLRAYGAAMLGVFGFLLAGATGDFLFVYAVTFLKLPVTNSYLLQMAAAATQIVGLLAGGWLRRLAACETTLSEVVISLAGTPHCCAAADTSSLRLLAGTSGESMFAPKVEARILQELGIRSHEHVLEIGTGSGHMAALAAHKARHVLSIEIDERLKRFGEVNLARACVRNVKVELGDGSRGWPARAPYDVIIVSGGLPALPPGLLEQLRIGGRLAAIVGDAPVMTAQIVTRVTDGGYDTLKLFETSVKYLRNAWRPTTFRF